MKHRCFPAGSVLLTVVGTIMVLVALIAAGTALTTHYSRLSSRSNAFARAIALGEGALEMLYADWQAQSREYALSHDFAPLPAFNATPGFTPSTAEFPALQNYQPGANELMFDPDSYRLQPMPIRGSSNCAHGPSPGSATYYFTASIDVTARALSRPVSVRLRRNFEHQVDSAWRFQVFADFDLEIQPEASSLALDGDVHSNARLFSGTSLLSIAGQASAANGFANAWAPFDSFNSSRPLSLPDFGENSPFTAARRDLYGLQPSTFDTTDANENNDGFRELIERRLPTGGDPLSGRRLYDAAGIKVLIDGANNLTVMDQVGNVHNGPTDPLYSTIVDLITTGGVIQDAHEAANVRIATVDVSKLTTAVENGTLPFNGVFYISDTSASPTARRAIRLWRGGRLPATGLTVATDNPIYIWGDYNTGGTYASPGDTVPVAQPASNLDGASPNAINTVSGYPPAPSAIFADATTILSNAWTDTASSASLAARLPANTTVNSGIVSGLVATNAMNGYGQGLEGMVRFLENWNPADLGGGGPRRRFTNHGALLSWWRPLQATGPFSYGVYYTAPATFLFYEKRFRINPPRPLLEVISFSKGRWYLD